MFIICDSCNKKFLIESNLIPNKGRMLECGNCHNKWYFEPNNLQIVNNKNDVIIKKKKDISKTIDNKKNTIKQKDNTISFLNNLLVILISFIGIILIFDTFKEPLSYILPGIIPFLDSLYETLFDLKLFIKDLFN